MCACMYISKVGGDVGLFLPNPNTINDVIFGRVGLLSTDERN